MNSKALIRQSTRHIAPIKQDDSDECIKILDSVPPAFGRSTHVKVEIPAVKSETLLSTEVSSYYLEDSVAKTPMSQYSMNTTLRK